MSMLTRPDDFARWFSTWVTILRFFFAYENYTYGSIFLCFSNIFTTGLATRHLVATRHSFLVCNRNFLIDFHFSAVRNVGQPKGPSYLLRLIKKRKENFQILETY